MTKQELKADIQAAYDLYLDGLDDLAQEFTIVPGITQAGTGRHAHPSAGRGPMGAVRENRGQTE